MPSLEQGKLIAGISCALATSLAAGNLETESSIGAIRVSTLALNIALISFNDRRFKITPPNYRTASALESKRLTAKQTPYCETNASTGKSRSPATIAATIRAATTSGVRPTGIFGATPAIARDAKPVSVCGGRASITSI